MGSLMSGWSSTVLGDDKKVRVMRNRSLTKEEVDAFWRQRGRLAEQDNGQGSPLGSPRASPLPSPRDSEHQQQESPFEGRRLDGRIRSLPATPLARGGQHFSSRSEPSSPAAAQRAEGFPESSSAAVDRPSTSCDWWTRSSWAFLNEPPHQQHEDATTSGKGRAHKGYLRA